jgi:phosphate transport system protein
MRLTLQEELAALEAQVQDEGAQVLEALRMSIEALAARDPERADAVIAFDDEIDGRYFAVEQGAQTLLARQTPVASDLRLVLAILRVNLHLERMGDYCVTVAKLTKLMDRLETGADTLDASVQEMGRRAEEMVRVALESFAARNLEGAESLVELDEAIDVANRRAVEDVLALGHDPDAREYGMRMLVVSRCIERIGDHAVDIGEQTAYLITGEFREFTDASHPVPPR